MTRVVLHIDRLVLRGVPAGERDALVQALQQTLTTQLAERLALPDGLARVSALGHVATLRCGPLAAPQGGAQALGSAAGRQLARGLS